MRFFLGLLFLVLSTPSFASDKVFNAEQFTLNNGMNVVLISNPRAPVITHMVWYNVGAADEQVGKTGLAHYLEHLMFKGTEKIAPGEFSKKIKALGGNHNAFTSYDYTAYFQSIASEHLRTVMEMEADRMRGLKVPEKEAASELQVILEERRQTLENNPTRLLLKDLKAALFNYHPYGRPIIGFTSDIQSFSLTDVFQFYNQFYAPNNATLIISGDVKRETLEPLANEIYGKLPASETIPTRYVRRSAQPLSSKTALTKLDKNVKQPTYYRLYPAPNWINHQKEALALSIFQELIAGGSDRPLYQKLVVKQKLATSIGFDFNSLSLGPADIGISGYLAPNIPQETLEQAINDFLVQYIDHDWSEEEIEQAVTKMQDSTIFLRDSVTGPAMIIGRALSSGMTLEEIETWPTLLETITAEDIKETAQKWLSTTFFVQGWLLPEGEVEK